LTELAKEEKAVVGEIHRRFCLLRLLIRLGVGGLIWSKNPTRPKLVVRTDLLKRRKATLTTSHRPRVQSETLCQAVQKRPDEALVSIKTRCEATDLGYLPGWREL